VKTVTYEEVRPLVDAVQYPGNLEHSLRRRSARVAATANAILADNPDRVLDVGSGGQPLPVLLARRGVQVDAVDHDAVMMKNLERLMADEPPEVQARITIHVRDVRDLPEGQTYPVVTACEVLEHMPEPAAVAKILAERVAPSGMLYITTPFAWMPDPDHKHSPMPSDHQAWLEGAGLVWADTQVEDSHLLSAGRAQPTDAVSPKWTDLVPPMEAESVRLIKFWLGERDRVVVQRDTAWEGLKTTKAQMKELQDGNYALRREIETLNARINRNPLVIAKRKLSRFLPG
jgi:SAM-dependent methyltransferase